jgi:CubicO group peptidase (beta-lactamase class C family)
LPLHVSESEIDRVLRAATAVGTVPGVVAAATDRQRVIYRGASGFADTGARRALRPDSVFRIASMTKLVTSIAVLQLRDLGLVDLDTPFARYYREFRQPPVLRSFDSVTREYQASPAGSEITVRQLLTHTSGFGYWFLNPELRALMGSEPEHYNPPFLLYEPGSAFQYGISIDVLGQLVAPMSGLTLPELFARRLFEPLGMIDTGFDVPVEADRLVALHAVADGGFAVTPNERHGEAPRGGGGLYSTAEDYLALLRMLLNDGRVGARALLARDTVRELASNQIGALAAPRQMTAAPERTADFAFMDGTQKFGFGVLLETRERPDGRAAGSYGWAGILNTYFWVDPAAEVAAVICMQMSPFCAPACLDLCASFERALYRHLGLRS